MYRISFSKWVPLEVIGTDFKKGIAQNDIFIYQKIVKNLVV